MLKKFALQEIKKSKYFYVDFMVYDCIPITIKITRKEFKNLVLRFKDNDIISCYTMSLNNENGIALFYVVTINY
jgi:hypothetical protein